MREIVSDYTIYKKRTSFKMVEDKSHMNIAGIKTMEM